MCRTYRWLSTLMCRSTPTTMCTGLGEPAMRRQKGRAITLAGASDEKALTCP